jgi:hypothetical protein
MAGKVTTALAVMEDGLRVWATPLRVGGVVLPAAGGGPEAFN